MANEFRIKHGLIVTGSTYISESVFAPNLPEETSPDYYITWRQSDGRFEISTTSPAQASTMACWDYGSGTTSGEFETSNGGFGTITSNIYLNNVDNLGNNQYNTLSTIGKGSTITMYAGALSTTFTVDGVKAPASNANNLFWDFEVTYVSGDQYSIPSGDEACLGVSGAVASGTSTGQCEEFVQATSFSTAAFNSGQAGFDRFVNGSNYVPPFGTIDLNVVALFTNGTTNNGNSAKTFFSTFSVNDVLTVNFGSKTTSFNVTSIGFGSGGTNAYIGLQYTSGDLNYTISSGNTFDVCKSTK